jgi:hypothetical protein
MQRQSLTSETYQRLRRHIRLFIELFPNSIRVATSKERLELEDVKKRKAKADSPGVK